MSSLWSRQRLGAAEEKEERRMGTKRMNSKPGEICVEEKWHECHLALLCHAQFHSLSNSEPQFSWQAPHGALSRAFQGWAASQESLGVSETVLRSSQTAAETKSCCSGSGVKVHLEASHSIICFELITSESLKRGRWLHNSIDWLWWKFDVLRRKQALTVYHKDIPTARGWEEGGQITHWALI